MNEIKTPRSGSNYQWVGKNTPRPDGVDKVTGRARYGGLRFHNLRSLDCLICLPRMRAKFNPVTINNRKFP